MALGRESCHPGEEGNPSAESGTLTRCRLTLVAAGPLPCGRGLMRSGSSALPWRSLWDGCPFPRGKIHPQGVNGSPGLIRRSDFVCKHPRVTGHPQTPGGPPPAPAGFSRDSRRSRIWPMSLWFVSPLVPPCSKEPCHRQPPLSPGGSGVISVGFSLDARLWDCAHVSHLFLVQKSRRLVLSSKPAPAQRGAWHRTATKP